MQSARPLARPIDDTDLEPGRVIIQDDENKSRVGFRARMDSARERTPDDVACRGLCPPLRHLRKDSGFTSVERTARLVPCGTRFLICRTWATESGPSSCSYWGRTLAARSCSA